MSIPPKLTPKEQIVHRELIEGLAGKDIANRLGISNNTVKTHIKNIYKKYEVHSRIQLILKSIEEKNNT